MNKWISFTLLTAGLLAQESRPAMPIVTSGLTAGSRKIEGRSAMLAVDDPRNQTLQLKICDQIEPLTSLSIDRVRGEFKMEFARRLTKGMNVELLQMVGETASAPLVIKNVTSTPREDVIVLSEPVREGVTEVSGVAGPEVKRVLVAVVERWTPAPQTKAIADKLEADSKGRQRALAQKQTDDAKKTVAELQEEARREACNPKAPPPPAKVDLDFRQPTAEAEVKGGRFTAKLDTPLQGGDIVLAIAVDEPWPPADLMNQLADTAAKTEVVSSLLDWGRLRGYFSIGGSVSHNRQQFSEVDTFIGFTADARLWGELVQKPAMHKATLRETQEESVPLRRFRAQVNLFTDARVGVRAAGSSTGASAVTTGATNASTPAPPNFSAINLPGTQTGFFQIGLHVPLAIKGMDWESRGHQYSFFVSPILKAGGTTLDASLVTFREYTVNAAPAKGANAQTLLRETKQTGVLPFYGAGFRYGLYEYNLLGRRLAQRQIANDPIGYLDFTYGRSRSFLSYETDKPQVSGDITTHVIRSQMLPRFNVEGRLKVPGLPALIGIDANIRTKSRGDDPNELRFTLAFRIDAQRALGRIFGSVR